MRLNKQHALAVVLLITMIALTLPVGIASSQPDRDFLDELAERTYAYLSSDWATSNHLPWSWRSPLNEEGSYANTTEIGLLLLSHLGAYEMHRSWSPDWTTVAAEVDAILDQLLAWQSGSQDAQPNGPNAYQDQVFYQWYWVNATPPVVGAGEVDHVVPSIDNAFLAASLVTLRAYGLANDHLELAQKADRILRRMDFRLWYDANRNLFNWGGPNDPLGGHWADYYSNENRIINFVARALDQLSTQEYQASLAALIQEPATYDRGTGYTSDDVVVGRVAWDGSYFTYMAPGLFIREMDTAYGRDTIDPATWAQITYATDQGYSVWGLSDCFDMGMGAYVQQGALPTAMSDPAETRAGLITPHASAMGLVTSHAQLAATNLQNIRSRFPNSFDELYGFYDSVLANPTAAEYGASSDRFSAIAQGWLFLSIVNAETEMIWNYFYQDGGVIGAHEEMFAVLD